MNKHHQININILGAILKYEQGYIPSAKEKLLETMMINSELEKELEKKNSLIEKLKIENDKNNEMRNVMNKAVDELEKGTRKYIDKNIILDLLFFLRYLKYENGKELERKVFSFLEKEKGNF